MFLKLNRIVGLLFHLLNEYSMRNDLDSKYFTTIFLKLEKSQAFINLTSFKTFSLKKHLQYNLYINL